MVRKPLLSLLLKKRRLLVIKKRAIQRKRLWWVHPINQRRDSRGLFNNLVQELREPDAVNEVMQVNAVNEILGWYM